MTRVFVIAEAGVNHGGDLGRALAMVDAAADSGADAVKFQTFRAELLASPSAPTAQYQRAAAAGLSQLEMLRSLELSEPSHCAIADRCMARGIEFMSTPFDAASAGFLASIGMRRIKVPSGELTNVPFLRQLAALELPLIVSTGMSSLEEVSHAVATLRSASAGSSPDPVLLHCTSNYPAAPADINLRAMVTMREATGLPVGYSDHTLGITAAIVAAALGASVIEKHFTLDRSLPGPDHAASLEVDELRDLVRAVREASVMLGSPEKRPSASELVVREVVRRSVAAARPMSVGHRLCEEDLTCLRPGTGMSPDQLPSLVGRVTRRNLDRGQLIRPEDLL
jgi:N,N'-diacetyllegionaminate synthase